MLAIIKKMFTVVISGIVNASNHEKCVSLGNQKCKIQSHYYLFAVKLEVVILWMIYLIKYVFQITQKINESKTLTKHILSECKCEFVKGKYNSSQWWNNNKCQCECRKHLIYKKEYI